MNGWMQRNRTGQVLGLCVWGCLALVTSASYSQPPATLPDSFSAQLERLKQSDEPSRDESLLSLAEQQAQQGHPTHALRALGMIRDQAVLRRGLQTFSESAGAGRSSADAAYASGERLLPGGSRGDAGALAPGGSLTPGGGRGGASFADFTQLINLIQTTIEPDSWEALGGTGTIQQYPQGILVDGSGLVVDVKQADKQTSDQASRADDSLDSITAMLSAQRKADQEAVGQTQDWKQAARFRCVSLRGLASEVVRRRLSNQPIDDSLRNLAGLSRIRYVWIDTANRDVLLVGTVQGIERSQGWYRDRVTGETTAQLEYLAATMQSVLAGQPFGCTIDPTNEGLAASVQVAGDFRAGQVPVGKVADALAEAIGKQQVSVFGTAGDTPLGYLLVEVDRHMKMLALGLEKMPEGVPNYLDVITQHAREGVPDGKLLRLWFMGSPLAVRTDAQQQVFELTGRPMKLACESQLPRDRGTRVVAPDDVRLVDFTNQFNQHLDEIIREYPAYGAVQSVFGMAAVAQAMQRTEAKSWMAELLGPLLLDGLDQSAYRTPRWVNTIATVHRFSHGSKRHTVVVASGGVQVDASETLPLQWVSYPALSSAPSRFAMPESSDASAQAICWWWNAR